MLYIYVIKSLTCKSCFRNYSPHQKQEGRYSLCESLVGWHHNHFWIASELISFILESYFLYQSTTQNLWFFKKPIFLCYNAISMKSIIGLTRLKSICFQGFFAFWISRKNSFSFPLWILEATFLPWWWTLSKPQSHTDWLYFLSCSAHLDLPLKHFHI